MQNADEVGAASVDFLLAMGYVTLGWFWAQMGVVAQSKLDAGEDDAFLRSKVKTAKFYFARLLVPRVEMHRLAALSGAATLMDFADEEFGA